MPGSNRKLREWKEHCGNEGEPNARPNITTLSGKRSSFFGLAQLGLRPVPNPTPN
jgi:hypothetical protein